MGRIRASYDTVESQWGCRAVLRGVLDLLAQTVRVCIWACACGWCRATGRRHKIVPTSGSEVESHELCANEHVHVVSPCTAARAERLETAAAEPHPAFDELDPAHDELDPEPDELDHLARMSVSFSKKHMCYLMLEDILANRLLPHPRNSFTYWLASGAAPNDVHDECGEWRLNDGLHQPSWRIHDQSVRA